MTTALVALALLLAQNPAAAAPKEAPPPAGPPVDFKLPRTGSR
jgi:hypothetical protein